MCPLCQQQKSREVRRGIREDADVPIYRCGQCRLQFLENTIGDLKEYYANEYRAKHDTVPGRSLSPEERFSMMRPMMIDSARRFKEEVPEGSSVLEIGCSSGYMLDAIGDQYDRFGNEWNPDDAAFVEEVGEIPCSTDDLKDAFPDKKFTAIIAMQVLEHQPDPLEWLRAVKSRLIGGGWLYLEIPNAMDALNTIYGIKEYQAFWYRRVHQTYWEKEALATALNAVGFEARVYTTQRYGLVNHINWLMNKEPMDDPIKAREFFTPVPREHPVAAILNRGLARLDKDYRTQMETIGSTDTIYAVARRREI